ncbi:MAG TPA: hypothetical protein VFM54_18775 [Micromonosporaceae bacterium]|nr:hypothetical protein [Micromonosporaceae bacterium]
MKLFRPLCSDPRSRRGSLPRALIVATVAMASTVLVGPGAATASASPLPDQSPAAKTTAAHTSAAPTSSGSSGALAAPAPSGSLVIESGSCGGKLTFGKVSTCASIVDARVDTWTFTSTVESDTVFATLTDGPGESVTGRVTDRNGASVCFLGPYLNECRLGGAGTYTVTVSLYYGRGSNSYLLSVESMRAPSECANLPESFFSFASDGRSGVLPAGLAAYCYKFDQPTGTVLHLADPSKEPPGVAGYIRDAQYQPLCLVGDTRQCTLSQPGPYRLFLTEPYGNEAEYTLKMPRISNAMGCPTVPLAPFGDPGRAVGTGNLMGTEDVDCQTLTTAAPGAVVVRLDWLRGPWSVGWTMYDAAGQRVCEGYWSDRYCALPAAGTYAILVESRNYDATKVTYQVAAFALNRNDGCAPATGTHWDQPALLVHQTSPVQANCQPFHGEAGERVIAYTAATEYNDVVAWLVDATGAVLCAEWSSEQDGCVLPATGTYRVISYLRSWYTGSEDLTYKMQVRRLSNPVGCPTVTPGSYGAAPAGALGGIRCRTLEIPAAGIYRVKAAGADNYRVYARVYDSAGLRTCGDLHCPLPAAGTYTLVLGEGATSQVFDNDFQYAVALLPWTPSNCPTVPDTGWQDAPHRGEFLAAGQYNCLELASPAGARVIGLLPGDATGAGRPSAVVVDATGAFVCDWSWGLYSCGLTGTAPFFAVLDAHNGYPTGSYALAFARMDGPPACPVLPRDAMGATVTTGPDHFAMCFSIPADQHAARETFTWRRTSGTGDARMSVFSEAGYEYCGPTGYHVERTITCSLPAGPVTVMLETDAVDATYQLTHRDASTPAP